MEEFNQLWDKPMSNLEQTNMEWAGITMRNIWLKRNDFFFKNKFTTPHRVVQEAKEELQEYQLAIKNCHQVLLNTSSKASNRIHQNMLVKANQDALVNKRDQKMGIGFFLRVRTSVVQSYLNYSRSFNSQPIIVECGALWRVMELCVELGFHRVQLEGDTQVVIKSIQHEKCAGCCVESISVNIVQVIKCSSEKILIPQGVSYYY